MTQKLLAIAEAHWVTIDGEAALRGVDPIELPFDRLLNAVYHFATRDGSEESRRRFEIRLWIPPAGVAPTRGPWSADAETQAFRGLKAALGQKVTAPPE